MKKFAMKFIIIERNKSPLEGFSAEAESKEKKLKVPSEGGKRRK
jgi:hypothetical protein